MLDMFGQGYIPPRQRSAGQPAPQHWQLRDPKRTIEDNIRGLREEFRRKKLYVPKEHQQPTPAEPLPEVPKPQEPPMRSVLKRGDWA